MKIINRSSLPIRLKVFLRENYVAKIAFLYFFVFALSLNAQPSGAGSGNTNAEMADRYNDKALKMLNEGEYGECQRLVKLALQEKENPTSYCILSHMYNVERKFDDAIVYGRKALDANPNFLPTYTELFSAYYSSNRWKDAQEIIEYCESKHISGFSPEQKETMEVAVANQNFSNKLVSFLLLIVAGVFIIPIYYASKIRKNYFRPGKEPRMSEAIVVGGVVSCCLYLLFFAFSKQIWTFYPEIAPNTLAPNMRIAIFEHDGIESVVLYTMMFLDIVLTLLIMPLILKLREKKAIYLSVISILFLISLYYLFHIGFYPPMVDVDTANFLAPVIVISMLTICLFLIYRKNKIVAQVLALVLVAFSSLISAGPPSIYDQMYVLAPAYRMLHGFKISEIYFQYDLFLSFLAFAWMKMHFALEGFAYLGQIGFFLFFVGAFFFGDGFFKSKGLSIVFIVALVLARFYAIGYDVPTILQATPLRLDLWMILVFVAYKKGVHHWLVGFFLGLLILFHRNLGMIYLASYLEFIFALLLLDIIPLVNEKSLTMPSLGAVLMKHLRLNGKNLGLIAASIALCFILFHEFFSKSGVLYSKLGIMMTPISNISFYWYVPIFLSCFISLVYYYRDRLGQKYTSLALFIMFLLIGNSMYFFGRSHENNVLNISGILVVGLFVLIDMLIFLSPVTPIFAFLTAGEKAHGTKNAKQPAGPQGKHKGRTNVKAEHAANVAATERKGTIADDKNRFQFTWRTASFSLPFLFVMFISYYYSGRILTKSGTQYDDLTKLQFYYPYTPMAVDTATEKYVTNRSPKVYFLDYYSDFFHYYYGNYVPQGYFNPCATWVYKKDILVFLQDLLDKGYYLVYNAGDYGYFGEYLHELKYNQTFQNKSTVSVSKQDVPLLLPETVPSEYHIGIKDSLSQVGLDYSGLKLKDEFTLELIIKPLGNNLSGETILSNLSKAEGMKGFTLQKNGTNNAEYGFGFSNGGPAMVSAFFPMESNQWHYLAITVGKGALKIYDNGNLVANVTTTGGAYVNSDLPLVIGNQVTRDAHFKGYIREVKFSDGLLDAGQITNSALKLAPMIGAK